MVWYFAYGSNMNPKVLSGRRKVFPIMSEPGLIQDWYLNFDVVGIPYAEPAFASIGQRPIFPDQPCVHGMLHQITDEDLQQIIRTEGHNYKEMKLVATKYNGKQVDCIAIVWTPKDYYHDRFYSSKRYMDLLVEGATKFDLDSSYISFLKTIPYYQNPGSLVHTIGKWMYLSMVISAALPLVPPLAFCRLTKREVPHLIRTGMDYMVLFFGIFYQFVFRPVFGNGAGEPIKQKLE